MPHLVITTNSQPHATPYNPTIPHHHHTHTGSRACFTTAAAWLESIGFPTLLVIGNHDLEGEEFVTDEENLDAWLQVWMMCAVCVCDVYVYMCVCV